MYKSIFHLSRASALGSNLARALPYLGWKVSHQRNMPHNQSRKINSLVGGSMTMLSNGMSILLEVLRMTWRRILLCEFGHDEKSPTKTKVEEKPRGDQQQTTVASRNGAPSLLYVKGKPTTPTPDPGRYPSRSSPCTAKSGGTPEPQQCQEGESSLAAWACRCSRPFSEEMTPPPESAMFAHQPQCFRCRAQVVSDASFGT